MKSPSAQVSAMFPAEVLSIAARIDSDVQKEFKSLLNDLYLMIALVRVREGPEATAKFAGHAIRILIEWSVSVHSLYPTWTSRHPVPGGRPRWVFTGHKGRPRKVYEYDALLPREISSGGYLEKVLYTKNGKPRGRRGGLRTGRPWPKWRLMQLRTEVETCMRGKVPDCPARTPRGVCEWLLEQACSTVSEQPLLAVATVVRRYRQAKRLPTVR